MSKRALGQTKQRFEIRPGISGITQYVGVMTEGDPGSIPAYALQRGLNLRRSGLHWGCRPGLTQALESPIHEDACVKDISSFACDPLRLYFVTFGCTGVSGPLGATLIHYDPEQDPALQSFAQYFSAANKKLCLGAYSGRMYIGDLANLRQIVLMPTPVGETAIAVVGAPPDSTVHSFTSTWTITCLQEFDGKLFIGINQGGGVGSVWIYNGLSIIQDVGSIDPPTAFCLWRDQLAMSFAKSVGELHLRPAGDPGTSWTSISQAGAGAYENGNSMISYRDKIYMADGDTTIWESDGATISAGRVISGAGDGSSTVGVSSLAVLNDLLYYVWNADSDGDSAVGQFDDSGGSAEWNDTLKNIQAQVANARHAKNMVAYRNTLYVGYHDAFLLSSPGLVISGTWNGSVSSVTTNFGIAGMLVY